MKQNTNSEAAETVQTEEIPAVAPAATCSPVGALIVFATYTVIYEAMIWSIFGWAVFINGGSGWWVLVAIFCSASQLKPKHFGIKVSEENVLVHPRRRWKLEFKLERYRRWM